MGLFLYRPWLPLEGSGETEKGTWYLWVGSVSLCDIQFLEAFMAQDIRVRFAPSPTGYLHVGGARTALYNFLYAKNQEGTFILRVEDTDQERSTEESLRMQIQDLEWLGLAWDEGVDPKTLEDNGDYGPYRQSQRLHIYKKYCDQLLESGAAYYDFRTDVESGEQAAVRFKVEPQDDFTFEDLVRGSVTLPSGMVGDFVILRSTGMPVYNFCCAVDDALMKISHVFRAEEHLSNTLRQKMIYEALGFDLPRFGHLSLILGSDRQKLSKRHGATSCNQYKESGYLPEALLNFITLLGWSSPEEEEIMSLETLVRLFSLERLNLSGAVFDEEKLKWMNAMHLRNLSDDDLWQRLQPAFKRAGLSLPSDPEWISKALTTFKVAMETLQDIERFEPVDDSRFALTPEGKDVLAWDDSPKVLAAWQANIKNYEGAYLDEETFGSIQNQVKESCGVKGKHLFMPIRVAVIGHPQGADLKSLVPLLNRESLLARVEKCLL